jgi:hypothetical protein
MLIKFRQTLGFRACLFLLATGIAHCDLYPVGAPDSVIDMSDLFLIWQVIQKVTFNGGHTGATLSIYFSLLF